MYSLITIFKPIMFQTNTASNVPVSYQTTVDRQTDEKRNALDELDMEEQSAKERLELEHLEKEEKAEQELKRKQDAERNAREMSKDELDLLQAAHQAQWDCIFLLIHSNNEL